MKRVTIRYDESIGLADALYRAHRVADSAVTSKTRGVDHPSYITTFTDGTAVSCDLTRTGGLSMTIFRERKEA